MGNSLALSSGNLFEMVFPGTELRAKAALVLAGSGLMALASHVMAPLPFTPVPVTAQTFVVLLLAALLGARMALAIQFVYLAEGLAGLPVFAPTASWALGRLIGPTDGYLLGFLAATWVVGSLADRGWGRRLGSSVAMMFAGECALYAIAIPWIKMFLGANWMQSLMMGLWPFLPGDLYKLILAALVLPGAWRVVRKREWARPRP